jgi:hypothetical protein
MVISSRAVELTVRRSTKPLQTTRLDDSCTRVNLPVRPCIGVLLVYHHTSRGAVIQEVNKVGFGSRAMAVDLGTFDRAKSRTPQTPLILVTALL